MEMESKLKNIKWVDRIVKYSLTVLCKFRLILESRQLSTVSYTVVKLNRLSLLYNKQPLGTESFSMFIMYVNINSANKEKSSFFNYFYFQQIS